MTAEIIPLIPKRGAKQIHQEYEFVLRQATENGWQPKCYKDSASFTDFEEPPTQREAQELCSGCPMFTPCREEAMVVKPAWGVMGGISWLDRRQYVVPRKGVA